MVLCYLDPMLHKKNDGFVGEWSFILSEESSAESRTHPLLSGFHWTDIGYYPRARYHYRERKAGTARYIFLYCLKGRGYLELYRNPLDHTITLGTGCWCIIPADTGHRYWADEKEPWTILWFHATGYGMDAYCGIASKRGFPQQSDRMVQEQISEGFDDIYRVLQRGVSRKNRMITSHRLACLMDILLFENSAFHPNLSSRQYRRIEESITYMTGHLDQRLCLEELASAASYSPSHYTDLFRHYSGTSPVAYFHSLKVQKACHLLRNSNRPVAEIAESLGFQDPYYFSRLFRKETGVSPRQFRKISF